MHFPEEAMMHIDAGIEVRLGFVAAHRAAKELSPTLFHPLTSAQGEPLPLRTAAGTVLRGAVRIDLLCRQLLHSLNHKDSIIEAAGSYNAALDLIHTALWRDPRG